MTFPQDPAGGPAVDLHCHSTASDGLFAPAQVVRHAHARGLAAIALTDHDTMAGLPEAVAEGEALGVRVVGGCEFSVAAPWGEMHVLGYFLPRQDPALEHFLLECREDRHRRARAMVHKLNVFGVRITEEDVLRAADGGAVGRPHVARALVRVGAVRSVQEAFDRYLGRGRPAYEDKALPTLREVAEVVHAVGGIVSAAHLKDRGTRDALRRFRDDGLDAVETRHPSHDGDVRATLTNLALELGLGRSGGSDWHGDAEMSHGDLGSQDVPLAWLQALEARRPVRS